MLNYMNKVCMQCNYRAKTCKNTVKKVGNQTDKDSQTVRQGAGLLKKSSLWTWHVRIP